MSKKQKKQQAKDHSLSIAARMAAEADKPFSVYCDEWLQLTKSRLKESSYIKYSAVIDGHIKRRLGGCRPRSLTQSTINGFSMALTEKDGLSPKTARDILTVLKSVLIYAGKQFPGQFPAVEIVFPREIRREARVLTRPEQVRFMEYLLTNMDAGRFGVLLAMLTGLRIGELCALRWDAVSLSDNTIRVEETMQRLKDEECRGGKRTKIIVTAPKSGTSMRVIPMTEFAAALCAQMIVVDRRAFVLTGSRRFIEPRTVQYRLRRYLRECGIEDAHFHTLRHTFATRCVEVGFELKSLSEILGHSSTAITLNRYVHSSIELKRDNMFKLSDVGM